MAEILKKEQFNEYLRKYYLEQYGERDTDVWYEQPAVNVWVFGRDDKIIAIKSDILSGEIEEKICPKQKETV